MIGGFFAQNMGSWWQSAMTFCDRWGNFSSIVALGLTLIGFGLTLRSLRRNRKITEEAERKIQAATEAARQEARQAIAATRAETQRILNRMGLYLLSTEVGRLLRFISELKKASRDSFWTRVVEMGEEARLSLVQIVANPYLAAAERTRVEEARDELGLILRYVERYKLKVSSAVSGLPTDKTKALDSLIALLAGMQAQLGHQTFEVSHGN